MEIEDIKPNKPNFGLVVTLSVVALLVIALAIAAVVSWRAKHATKTPYSKHPLSRLVQPLPPREIAA